MDLPAFYAKKLQKIRQKDCRTIVQAVFLKSI